MSEQEIEHYEPGTIFGHPMQPGRIGYVVLAAENDGEKDYEHYVVLRACPFCTKRAEVTVPSQGLWDWEHGTFVQTAFPDLNDSEREIVMTGTHQSCWDEAFPPEDEDYDVDAAFNALPENHVVSVHRHVPDEEDAPTEYHGECNGSGCDWTVTGLDSEQAVIDAHEEHLAGLAS